jgi:hypothetical protein
VELGRALDPSRLLSLLSSLVRPSWRQEQPLISVIVLVMNHAYQRHEVHTLGAAAAERRAMIEDGWLSMEKIKTMDQEML